MNTNDSVHRALLTLGTCLLLGLNTAVLAQDTKVTREGQTAAAGFDIVISDGVFTHKGETSKATLENVVDLLRNRHPDANIIVAPEVQPILINNLKIRATELRMELEALRVASGERFTLGGRGSDKNPLYVLEPAPVPPQNRLCVEAFGLGGYFASLPKTDDADANEALIEEKIEELERMVYETVEIYQHIGENRYGRASGGRGELHLRFHRGANLLIVIGDPESIEIAAKVIGALPQAQRSGGAAGSYREGFRGFGWPGRRSGWDPFVPDPGDVSTGGGEASRTAIGAPPGSTTPGRR